MNEVPPAAASALQPLRQATAARHDEIENLLQLDRIASRDRLVQVLQVFDAFLHDWEPRIAKALPPQAGEWFERHRRGPWAAQDLKALGAPRLPRAPAPDIALDSPAQALGSLYVIEGSALGGKIIARHLHAALGLDEATGARFFSGRGEHTGRVWREYGQWLAAGVPAGDPSVVAQCCEAADRTFAALLRQFRERLAEAA